MFLPHWSIKFPKRERDCMDDAKCELVQSWLTKALHDLASAEARSALQPPLFDTAVYHCQQAGEKAIKGFLVSHDEAPPKTHLLGQLIAAAARYHPRFALFSDAADLLTPLATEYRYPGSLHEPTQPEFHMAYQYADEIYTFALSLIPEEARPKR
jgi:HEPN domain-containing protein